MSVTPDVRSGWRPARGRAEPASEAERAVLRTVTYAGLFRFPLTLDELHRSLMDAPLDAAALRERLARPFLSERVSVTQGLVHPRGREEWVGIREQRRLRTRALLDRHRRILSALAAFPFVRLVALSGGCAHGNAIDDDVDVFLVARRGRAWAVCLALMVLAKLLGLRRTLCVNYIVDEEAEALPETDWFTAAEIVGMKPLAGREAYRRFVSANAWAARHFPNFFGLYESEGEDVPEVRCPRAVERLLDLVAAPLLEGVSRRLLGSYLRWRMRGAPGVVLTPHRLKLHTLDHRSRFSALFAAALREAGDSDEPGGAPA